MLIKKIIIWGSEKMINSSIKIAKEINKKDYSSLKQNYVGLDIFRLILLIGVCAFHTTVHLGADYGILQAVSKMGAVFMTAFFMLSGFSLFVNYSGYNVIEIKNLKLFWVKRIIGILPMYYIVALIYIIANFTNTIPFQEILLAPIEILCLQSNFSSLFGFTHNSGTWFISCIIMCYIVYPLFQEIVKQITAKTKIIAIIFLAFILLYSPIIVWKFNLVTIYSNPFFRILEFCIGILLASLTIYVKDNKFVTKFINNWFSIFIEFLLMIIGITVAFKLNIGIGNYMLYSWICLPIFMLILFGLSGVKSTTLSKSKVLKYCSNLAYTFFLAQLFLNTICKKIITKYSITNNICIILLGWASCIVIALVLHEFIEKPVTRFLKKKLLIKDNFFSE